LYKYRIFTGQFLWKPQGTNNKTKIEPFCTDFLLAHASEDHVFMDAGAGWGYYSVVLSPHVKRVIAVEPRPLFAELIHKGIETNELDNVEVVETALFDTEGYCTMPYKAPAPQTIAVADSGFPLMTLDALMDSNPLHMLKIDVDGAEVNLLDGALETIEEHHPIMVIEVHMDRIKEYFDRDPLEILEILWHHGYRIELLQGRVPVARRLRECARVGGDSRIFLGATWKEQS